MKLVIATKNQNKIKEIKEKFSVLKYLEIISLAEFNDLPYVVEDGTTFEENALKKGREYAAFTGFTVLSDDSGLEVDALNGEPGVLSARYSGENATDDENIDLLLGKLRNVSEEKSNARFVCVIAIVEPSGGEYLEKGVCEGRIIKIKAGANGFGYDPVFYIDDLGKTMAELSLAEKNKISHRAIALDKAVKILSKIAGS